MYLQTALLKQTVRLNRMLAMLQERDGGHCCGYLFSKYSLYSSLSKTAAETKQVRL
jgi:hypothetical protein